ncbi:electron transport complex subunit C [Thiosulfatimonas sediminis]|uniref:Ion-translocating oxidoreductase complex subunit C n=1 Tax=Thiosulfatimonas sediminis TaxID=2675054 RepID=A0A6F8PVF2_9GAMM|nr:electron transport complex subunit RsxC [Thiosulfatimonas sediminis]BBP46076.1 electron transport complex subunit C [Thiosulfatimonas sediminis]
MNLRAVIASKIAPIYPMAKRWLHRFHGGVFPQYNKSLSTRNPIYPPLMPKELILPLPQAVGESALPIVKVGQRVLKNQLLAQADSKNQRQLVVPIHAPTSGIIAAIEPRTLPHASGMQALCLILQPDGQNQAIDNVLQVDGHWPKEPQALKDLLLHSGIIGMGGAGFPTYAKLPQQKGKITTLVINGAECEPFISCDDLLMQTQAKSIWLGAQITAQALGCQKIICGIENNKPKAIALMQAAADALAKEDNDVLPMHIQQVATVYPMGGQKQLVLEITGLELESGGHAIDQGLLMMNVATLRAIYRAVVFGEPLTSRLVTVSGEGLEDGFNIDALIGTPFTELTALAKPKSPINYPLIMGGPMMGVQMPDNHVPVLKTTNCVLANPPEARQMQMPCIRCGECMDACPINLLPQQMYWHAQGHEYAKVEKLNIKDCIECGCCSYVCPSHIPLVQYYRHAKAEIRAIKADAQAKELAKQRHEFRLERIEREKAEREARLKAKKEAVKQAPAMAPKSASGAAQAAAKARAAAKSSASNMSARDKAIQAAQAAAAKQQGQTDNDKKTKGQSLGTAKDKVIASDAAKKRAQAAAQAAAAKRAQNRAVAPVTEDLQVAPPNARDKAIAAAKDAANKIATQTTDLSSNDGQISPALAKEQARKAAIAKAREAALAHKKTDADTPKLANPQTGEPTETNNARQKAIAAAKAAAAKRAAKVQSEQSDSMDSKDSSR